MGTERRDGLWHHPDLLPVGDDLENPAAVIDRLLDESTEDSSGVDEIEQFLREAGGGAEASGEAGRAADGEAGGASDGESGPETDAGGASDDQDGPGDKA